MLNPYNEPPQENILSTVRRGLARFALPSALIIAVAGSIYEGVTALDKQEAGTHFANAADAMAKLQANIAQHGDDTDNFGPDQGRMERDLRGANPLIMQKSWARKL